MSGDIERWSAEIEEALDALSYELTAARTAGVDKPAELREIVRRIGRKVADLEALAGSVEAARARAEEV